MTKEENFFKALQEVFVGVKIEGEGGFINLMRIKSRYYSQIEKLLKADIDKTVKKYPAFREELFDKLFSFFSRYFSESGSILFNSTPFHNNVYEKVYTNEQDVILFWKTHMLFYVKTDNIFRSLPIEFDDLKLFFDASTMQGKRANEKRSLVFDLKNIRTDGVIVFAVNYSKGGAKTKHDVILKELKKKKIRISEEQLLKAFKIFNRQSQVDYFINKNANAFLKEQFKLWSYQYFWVGANDWSKDRINELQVLKDIAFKTIDFISQFEEELVRVWNKPKFVRNSNYVITLDRIGDLAVVNKILKAGGMKDQIKEWQALGIADKKFKASDIFKSGSKEKKIEKKFAHLPIDTKHFKALENEILSLFNDLDNQLDGWLIKSENYQALQTILPKFQGKIQSIYIDPPFNTGDDFPYLDKFKDSSWLSLMNDRLSAGFEFLNSDGSFWLHLDDNANDYGKELIKGKFSQLTEIIFDTNATKDEEADLFGYKSFGDNFQLKHQTLFYCRNDKYLFRKLWKPNRNTTNLNIGWLDLIAFPKKVAPKKIADFEYKIEKWNDGSLELEKVEIPEGEKLFPVGDIWNDIFSFTQSEMRVSESFSFTSSQKPENLLRRIIQSTTEKDQIVMDYFLGIGTTTAVAHKLGRKWIGIEMGDHFEEIYETEKGQRLGVKGRMKWVLNGDRNISCLESDRRPHLTKDVGWQGGGFFKYYELEQYEEALDNCKYEDCDLFNVPGRSPYNEYVFMKDEKMLAAMEVDEKKNRAVVDLSKLYPDIDIAESLSNLSGRMIKHIDGKKTEFDDGSEIDISELDYKKIKPLIWW
ncbi:MAG: site-specific DNA-methyltransferase [Actinobacteria bacterium]|nr:site-specific DNA-methyltransferase [Actinomycetota bacterium]